MPVCKKNELPLRRHQTQKQLHDALQNDLTKVLTKTNLHGFNLSGIDIVVLRDELLGKDWGRMKDCGTCGTGGSR
jgi:hypothetical protein